MRNFSFGGASPPKEGIEEILVWEKVLLQTRRVFL